MRKGNSSSERVDTQLSSLEFELNTLKRLFEDYFSGVLKMPPEKEHNRFKRMLSKFTMDKLSTTASRFKFQSIQNRYVQLKGLWARSMREKEEGHFRTDVFKKNHTSTTPQANPEARGHNTDKQIDEVYLKLSQLASGKKIPSKEEFAKSITAKITQFKQKNPNSEFEISAQRDRSGKIQLKLKSKK